MSVHKQRKKVGRSRVVMHRDAPELLCEAMFDQVMRSLRWHVEELEEEDTVDTVLQRRIKGVVETQPSASEVDMVMESLMEPSSQGLA
jgi:hypothetical protein